MAEDSPNREPDLHLILEFDWIEIDELADLLAAIRSIAFRSLIRLLAASNNSEGLHRLARSHQHFLEAKVKDSFYYSEFLHGPRWNFDFHFSGEDEPALFDAWTRYLADKFPLEVRSITLGSYDFGVYIAGLLLLIGPNLNLNYSLAKDLTNQVITLIRQGIISPRPNGHIEHVPDIVQRLANNPRIKKLEVRSTDSSINIKAEFQNRRR